MVITAVLVAVFAASFVLPHVGGTRVRICPFYLLTHTPCPGCGMGRSFVATSAANLPGAFRAHLLGPFFYLFLLGLLVVQVVELSRRRPWRPPPWARTVGNVAAGVALAATLVAWVLRLTGVWPLPS